MNRSIVGQRSLYVDGLINDPSNHQLLERDPEICVLAESPIVDSAIRTLHWNIGTTNRDKNKTSYAELCIAGFRDY